MAITKYYKLTKRGKQSFAYGDYKRKPLWEGNVIIAIALQGRRGITKDDIFQKYRGVWWGRPSNQLTRPKLTAVLNKLKRDGLIG